MPLESGSYISDLNPANPSSVDPTSQGDDHIRLVKNTIKQTFPNLTGAMTANQAQLNKMVTVTATDAELNRTVGLTEDLATSLGTINTRLDAAESALSGAETTPAGTIVMFGGAVAPAGWTFCDGSAHDRVARADLFAAIGTTFGSGNGSTTFNVPDFTDRFPRGAGGDYNLGVTHADQNKAHTHSVTASGTTSSNGDHSHTTPNAGQTNAFSVQSTEGNPSDNGATTATGTTSTAGAHTHTVTVNGTAASQGGSEAMPKGIAVNYIIKL